MAVTGAMLFVFVSMHLLGNLQIFLGPEVFNSYAAFLKSIPEFLWPARIGLLCAFVLHIVLAFQLRKVNSGARPKNYHYKNTVQASIASRYMLQSGLVILWFVIIHLMHFTFLNLQPQLRTFIEQGGREDVYSRVIFAFMNPYYAGFYIFSMLMLGMHLSHALSSMFQTFGFWHPHYTPALRRLGRIAGYAIALGYITIPLAAQLGLLHPIFPRPL